MRTASHVIDTKSVVRVLSVLPDYWVVRGLSERDYGMDLQVEIFLDTGRRNRHGKIYESTGCLAHLQLKGTSKRVHSNRSGQVRVSVPVKTLLYAERFASPFFLVRVDVSHPRSKSYFLWLQRYIADVLDEEAPKWRLGDVMRNITLRIPARNSLPGRVSKIERIARRPKYLEELVAFSETYSLLELQLDAIQAGKHTFDRSVRDHLIQQIHKIGNLRMLLANNDCCVDDDTIAKLRGIVRKLSGRTPDLSGWNEFSERDNLTALQSSVGFAQLGDKFVAELSGETVY